MDSLRRPHGRAPCIIARVAISGVGSPVGRHGPPNRRFLWDVAGIRLVTSVVESRRTGILSMGLPAQRSVVTRSFRGMPRGARQAAPHARLPRRSGRGPCGTGTEADVPYRGMRAATGCATGREAHLRTTLRCTATATPGDLLSARVGEARCGHFGRRLAGGSNHAIPDENRG